MVKNEQRKLYLLYLLIFLYMLLINFKCGFLSDDYHFLFVWKDFYPTGNDKPVENFSDIIESAKNYYNLSGGRVVPHFFNFLMANVDKWVFANVDKCVFNILNSAVFVILGRILYLYTKKDGGVFLQAAVYMSMFLMLPAFGDSVIWLSGAVNYLWPGTLLMYCIYFCERNFDSKKAGTNVIMLLLTALSASTNEMTGGMLAVWLTAHLITKKRKINIKAVLFYILCIGGECLVVLAPGNANRAAKLSHIKIFDFSEIAYLAVRYSETTFICFGVGFGVILAAVFVLFKYNKLKSCIDIIPLAVSGTAGIGALTLIGHYYDRPLIFGLLLWIAAMWKMVIKIFEDNGEQAAQMKKEYIFSLLNMFVMLIILKLICNILRVDWDNNYFLPMNFVILSFLVSEILNKKNTKSRKTIELTDAVIRKGKIFASVLAIAFLGYAAYDYFNAMDQAYEVMEVNYIKYINGEPLSEFNLERNVRLFPHQAVRYTIKEDFDYDWLIECEENNIDCPEVKGF